MIISRGTTPTFEFKFPLVISNYSQILISFSQDHSEILDKGKADLALISGTTYKLTLDQDEINLFTEGIFECQVRVVTTDNTVAASKIYRGRIQDVLNDTILEV